MTLRDKLCHYGTLCCNEELTLLTRWYIIYTVLLTWCILYWLLYKIDFSEAHVTTNA